MTAKDPVCGMDVQADRAAGKSEHQGQTYHFCSSGCKQKFDQNPDRYAGQKAAQQQGPRK
jgi:P-type Cu+ transporter